MLDREGRFLARIKTRGIIESKENHIPQFVAELDILQGLAADGAWEDWSGQGAYITAYLSLAKIDGSMNKSQIDSLKDALGWNGQSLEDLASGPINETVQIETRFDTYKNHTRLKVAWINPADWDGVRVEVLDTAGLRAMNARWGAKLRACAGPVKPAAPAAPGAKAPAPAPAPKQGPSAPARPAPAPARPAAPAQAPAAPAATRDQAWEAFLGKCAGDEAKAGDEFWSAFEHFFPGSDEKKATGEMWHIMLTRGVERILPF